MLAEAPFLLIFNILFALSRLISGPHRGKFARLALCWASYRLTVIVNF